MLTADQIDALVDPILELYERFQDSVIQDIARRLAGLDYARPMAAWQMQRLSESGALYASILDRLAMLTGKSESELRAMFEKAGVKALKFDDAIYRAAGLNPLPLNLSPAMAQVLAAGLNKTNGLIKNLTMTTAISGQNAFLDAADLAYMQVSSGAMSYQQAMVEGVKKIAADGLSVIQFPGRRDQLDVAMRRAILTGVNQTVGQLQTARADEMGVDLVQTSAHIGARNTGTGPANHEGWQGRIFSRSGNSKKYPSFIERTGYGTGPGLCGWGCRHSFFPWFEGLSADYYTPAKLDDYANKTVKYNDETLSFYDATQKQRSIERKIRYWKRQKGALDAAGLDSNIETGKVRDWQARMRDFTKQTGLIRQSERERFISPYPKTKRNAKKIDLYSRDNHSLGGSKDLQNIFSPGYAAVPYHRSAETHINSYFKKHIREDHPERIDWITNHANDIALTIQQPDLIERAPWKRDNGHWSQTFIREIPEENGFAVVAVSLANLPGEIESEYHQVTSIYFSKKPGTFFRKNGEVKEKWILAK